MDEDQCCTGNIAVPTMATNSAAAALLNNNVGAAMMTTDYDNIIMANNNNNNNGGGCPATQQNKMFVGGLAQTVTSEFLRAYFANFGPVQDAFVLMDEQSGRSRGFGFVTFENAQTLRLVLKQKPHILGNKQVDCKHAVNKTGKRTSNAAAAPPVAAAPSGPPAMKPNNALLQAPNAALVPPGLQPILTTNNIWAYDPLKTAQHAVIEEPEIVKDDASPFGGEWSDNESSDLFLTGGGKSYLALSGDKWLEDCEEADARKIFVGGLPDITPLEFAKYFEHFGPVADAMIMYDRKRRRQRGFGFITFASDEGVRNSLNFSRHPVKGKVVEVKKAHPLVLQKARAPAKQELEAERAAAAAAAAAVACPRDPFGLTAAYNKTSPAIAAAAAAAAPPPPPPPPPPLSSTMMVAGHTLVDAGGGSSLFPKYPEAPWHK